MAIHNETASESFKLLLKKLVDNSKQFTTSDLRHALQHLLMPHQIPPEQIGAFLTALHIHRIERNPELLATAAAVFRERAVKISMEDAEKDFVVDIVGTGGDGYNLFNVSTAAGIVAAGAGARVVKHGSKASTSSSGSADFLQALGCSFSGQSIDGAVGVGGDTTVPPVLPRIPFSFLLASQYHPALNAIAPHRKALPFRTIFNVLGPLISPARPKGMVLGVPDPALGLPFAQTLRNSGVKRALVVCGQERLDEISCAGPTWVWELSETGNISEGVLSPESFGLDAHPLALVKGGSAEENAEALKVLLTRGNGIPNEKKPLLDFVLMNAAALLVIAGLADDYKQGVRLAFDSIVSGRAWEALDTWRNECGRQGNGDTVNEHGST